MRILRILEYVGDEKWIRTGLEHRAVKGERVSGNNIIREGFVGAIPLLGFTSFDEDRELPTQQEIVVDGERIPFRTEEVEKE